MPGKPKPIPAKLLEANGWEQLRGASSWRRLIGPDSITSLRLWYIADTGRVELWTEHDCSTIGHTHDIGVLNMLVAALEAMQ